MGSYIITLLMNILDELRYI